MAILFLATCNVWAQAIAKDDAYVTSASSSTNYGSSTSLVVQTGGSNSYIRFDLSRIPTGAAPGGVTSSMVQKATVRLFVTAVTANGTFDVMEVGGTSSSQNWSESTITYSSQSSYALFPRTLATGVPVSYPTPNSKNQYIIVDITPAVKDWLDNLNGAGGQYNNGIILKPSTGSSISVALSSKEDTTSSHDPELNIVWEPSTAQIVGQINPNTQIGMGTAPINVTGSAGTLLSTTLCSSGYATGINITGAAQGCTYPQFSQLGGAASITQLPAALVYNNQANTFGAGFKQTFTANPTLAGLNVAGVANDPSTLVSGDLWFNATLGRLNFRNGSVHSLAFLDDVSNIQNSQLGHSSISINTATGSGLSGGGSVALGNALSLSIPAGGVTNGMLQNSSIGVTAGSGIAVAGTTSLGGSFSITNIGVLSFNTRTGLVMPMTGDYSFAQLSGTAAKNQLPGTVVYSDQSNTFGIGLKQIFQSNGTAGLNVAAALANNNPASPAAGDVWFRLDLKHLHFYDGTSTHQLMFLDDTIPGSQVVGNIAGSAGSIVGNIPESQVTNLTSDLGTLTTNLSSERFARQSADTTLQNNINSEALARAAADTTLQSNINGETTRAQGAETALSTGKANLAGGNIFITGKQVLAASASSYASLNVPNSATAPTMPATGDIWLLNTDSHLNFRDMNGISQMLAFTSDVTTATAAITAETRRATAAETTLTTNLANETSARQSADTAEATARSAADSTESATRAAADLALGGAITNETTRAQGAEATLGSSITAETTRATAAELTKADLVKPVQVNNAALAKGLCSSANALVLNPTQPSGQQMFVCRDMGVNGLQWQLINDDSATTTAANSYTDSKVATEAATRAAADTAEAAARTAGDAATLTSANGYTDTSVASETTARIAGDATTLSSANSHADAAVATEATTRMAADATLGAAITGETTRATGAETTLQSSITALDAASAKLAGPNTFTADNTFTGAKVDLSGAAATLPVKTTTATPPASGSPNACVAGQMLLQTTGDPGKQLFICNAALDGWVMVNDDSATTATDKSYTDAQVAAEATARIAGDAATLSSANSHSDAAVAAEATTRAAADATLSAAIASETSRATTAETALSTSKAKLVGGNSFTGDQSIIGNVSVTGSETVNGTLSLPAANSGVSPSQRLDLSGSDGTNPTLFRWFVNSGGKLDLFTATNGNAAADSGLMIGPDGKIIFAAGQTFPGTNNGTVTSVGTGAGLTGGPITTSGTISIATGGVTNAMLTNSSLTINTPANSGLTGGGSVPLGGSLSLSIPTNGVTNAMLQNSSIGVVAGTGIGVTGTSSLGGSFSIANTGVLSFNGRNGVVTAVANDYSFAQLSGTDSATSNLVYNNQANTYTAGSKQTFKASPTLAGLSFDGGVVNDPSTLASGDTWFNSTANHLKFFDGSTTKTLAFTTDIAAGTVTGTGLTSGQLIVGAGGSSIATGNLTGDVTTSGSTATTLAATIAGSHTFSNAANSFTGNGAGLTSLTAANISAGTANINISGNAATANTATSAATATTASSASTAPFSGVTASTNAAALVVGTGGSLTTSGTGTINASSLGGVTAANYARTDQGNTFTGQNVLGNTAAAGSGGLLIPPSASGAQKVSFPFDMEATNTGNNLHLFRIIAQDGTTPNWGFQFCNSAPCTPASNGLSIAGSTGIITFAAGQTFPGAGSGTVTSFSSGNLAQLFTTSVATATTTPALSFSLTSQAANSIFAGPNGASGVPTFRSIVAADLPATISSNTTGTAANVTGTVAILNGGTGQTTAAAARTALGAAASGANVDITSLTALTSVTSAVTMSNASNSFNGTHAGNGAALTSLTPANISAGTAGISITGNAATATTAGNVTGIVAVANGGTGANASATAANQIFASPSGASGAPTFRAIAAADLPTPQNTRAICYVAGADNSTAPVLTTNDSQKSFFRNLIGNMTITSASCQVDAATSVTVVVNKNNSATNVTVSAACSATPGTWTTLSLGTTAVNLNDSLDLSITGISGAPRRLTVCLAGTVN